MRAGILLVLGFLPAVSATAQPAQAIRVHGLVLDPSGTPIVDGRAELHPYHGPRDSRTSEPAASAVIESGRFSLRAPAEGLWKVTVHAPGAVSMQHPLVPLLDHRNLRTVQLRADAGFTVTLRDPAEEPVIDARVRVETATPELWRPANARGRVDPETGWSPAPRTGRTDTLGQTRLAWAEGERLDISALAVGYEPAAWPDEDAASESTWTGVLAPAKPGTLAVSDTSGEPLVAARVTLHASEHAAEWFVGTTDEEGRVALPTFSGVGGLTLTTSDRRSQRLALEKPGQI